MGMAKVTRTLNPLPFNDLEPHRFEDLVRQLAYDFRTWRSLEPTGRLGADDGYDARGFEIVDNHEQEPNDEEGGEIEYQELTSADRLWQIQCKREKTITPAKLDKYLDEMIPKGADIPYGVIFSAPCEFSKQTRDLFQQKLRDKGVQEFYMWGRADLEDMLVLPKNDHLLFAYFGISLVIRRRTTKSEIRALLATKRKTVKYLGEINQRSYQLVLVRDASDKSYPWIAEGGLKAFRDKPKWKMYYFVGHEHNGIRLLTRRYYAYRETNSESGELLKWDYSEEINLARVDEDYWNNDKNEKDNPNYRGYMFLKKYDEKNRAYLETEAVIPYDRIVEVDNLGDNRVHCPHIFVDVPNGSWFEYGMTYLKPDNDWGQWYSITKEEEKLRAKVLPKMFPEVKEDPLPPMGLKDKGSKKV
jgi:hypothetical protein